MTLWGDVYLFLCFYVLTHFLYYVSIREPLPFLCVDMLLYHFSRSESIAEIVPIQNSSSDVGGTDNCRSSRKRSHPGSYPTNLEKKKNKLRLETKENTVNASHNSDSGSTYNNSTEVSTKPVSLETIILTDSDSESDLPVLQWVMVSLMNV